MRPRENCRGCRSGRAVTEPDQRQGEHEERHCEGPAEGPVELDEIGFVGHVGHDAHTGSAKEGRRGEGGHVHREVDDRAGNERRQRKRQRDAPEDRGGSRAQIAGSPAEVRVERTERDPERQQHEEQVAMDEADDDAGLVEHELQRRIDQSQAAQRLIDKTVAAQQKAPAEGFHDDADEPRCHVEQEHHRLRSPAEAGDVDGNGIGEHRRDERDDDADAQGSQEDSEVVRIGQAEIVGKRPVRRIDAGRRVGVEAVAQALQQRREVAGQHHEGERHHQHRDPESAAPLGGSGGDHRPLTYVRGRAMTSPGSQPTAIRLPVLQVSPPRFWVTATRREAPRRSANSLVPPK